MRSRFPLRCLAPSLGLLLGLLLAPAAFAEGPGVVKFDERSFEVREGAGMALITVERSRGDDGAITVEVSTADGTAVAGADYTAVSATLRWEDGDESPKTLVVPILDDLEGEPSESVELALGGPTGGAAVDAHRGTALLLIADNDGGPGGGGNGEAGQIKFDQRGFQVLENGGAAVISVERSHGDDGAVSIDYATSDETATAGEDYTAVAGTLAWEDGEEDSKTFRVPVLDDSAHEPSETVRLTLSNPGGGATLHGHNAMLVIRDDDRPGDGEEEGPGIFRFRRSGFQVLESAGEARITVRRSGGDDGAVSVDYASADGSATAGEDYTAVAGTLSWADGEDDAKTFTVPVREDDLEEGDESVLLRLSNPTGGAAVHPEHGEAELVIVDNDGQTSPCSPADTVLCLHHRRFQVEVEWRTPDGSAGAGHAIPLSSRAGLFWFFNPENIEMLFKVLDACDTPFEAFWVFFAATTNVDFTVTVTDTATGIVKQYSNPAGQAAEPIQDTLTFRTCR